MRRPKAYRRRTGSSISISGKGVSLHIYCLPLAPLLLLLISPSPPFFIYLFFSVFRLLGWLSFNIFFLAWQWVECVCVCAYIQLSVTHSTVQFSCGQTFAHHTHAPLLPPLYVHTHTHYPYYYIRVPAAVPNRDME